VLYSNVIFGVSAQTSSELHHECDRTVLTAGATNGNACVPFILTLVPLEHRNQEFFIGVEELCRPVLA
jgi:hypothetical protein